MVALQTRTWTRSRELELKDAISILQVEPKRLGNMWDSYDLLKAANNERINRLNTQIELFEGERQELVEAAFRVNKELKQSEAKLVEMTAQRNSLRDILSKETALKNEYYMASRSLVFYQSVSVIALLAVLFLTIMVAR